MAKDQKVDLQKSVFNKSQYEQTIDTEFSEFGVTSIQEDLQNETTVEDFFTEYNELFYDIPAEGDVNSHQYLVRTSGEYISFDANQEEIDALRDEIAILRQENLELVQENANLLLSSSAS
jgi:hypothetical protein